MAFLYYPKIDCDLLNTIVYDESNCSPRRSELLEDHRNAVSHKGWTNEGLG